MRDRFSSSIIAVGIATAAFVSSASIAPAFAHERQNMAGQRLSVDRAESYRAKKVLATPPSPNKLIEGLRAPNRVARRLNPRRARWRKYHQTSPELVRGGDVATRCRRPDPSPARMTGIDAVDGSFTGT